MKYDAIIIGSGQGGNPLAHRLADEGWKIAMIEKEHLGGSCVNYGCTPTKTMVASAKIANYVRRAGEFGIQTGEVTVNMPAIVERKNKMVAAWRGGQEKQVAERDNIDLFRGHGRFVSAREVSVGNKLLTSEKIFINTGTRPRIPDLPGLSGVDFLTNKNLMDLRQVPSHLLVLGGNYLGLEFGQLYRRLGAEVSIVEISGQITPREDEEVGAELQRALEKEGMVFYLDHKAVEVKKIGPTIQLVIESGNNRRQILEGSHLLIAIGRTANSDDLGLDKAGVETDRFGYVKTNEYLETNVPGIRAIGDIKGGPAFTNVSYDDFLILFDYLINEKKRSIRNRLIPYALFTDPELGRVGLSEKEARVAGYRLKIGRKPMAHVARAIERSETAGLMKIVINAENDRILGAAVLAPEGGEVVQILLAAMLADAPWTIFKRAVYIHPTLGEGFYGLMESVKEVV